MKEEIDEGRKMMNAAEQEYRRAVDVYNSVTSDWVSSWKGACDIFQEMEEKRIHYIHGSLRSFSSMMSSVYLVDDQVDGALFIGCHVHFFSSTEQNSAVNVFELHWS